MSILDCTIFVSVFSCSMNRIEMLNKSINPNITKYTKFSFVPVNNF